VIPLGVAAAVAVLIVGAVARSYNRFVAQRQLIANAWSNVDTELQRRHELVPNLVTTVRGYAGHEKATLDAVTSARQAAVVAAHHAPPDAAPDAGAENDLGRCLRQLLAVVEAYPELKASSHFLELQHELTRTENRLQASRRIFNGNVRDYNRRIESFPSLLVARVFRFSRAEYFELTDVAVDTAPRARVF
jgi:LemA protein